MTDLAYLLDMPAAYVREFSARIIALPPGGVVLDRTYFYPTGGGQPSDRGTLGLPDGPGTEVLDVVKSGTSVVHRWRAPSALLTGLARDSELTGRVDWPRRHRHMRLHTAQHLTSARVFLTTGLRTRRASLAGSRATIELEAPLPEASLAPIVEEVLEAIRRPRPVRIHYVPRAEWDRNPVAGRSGLVPLPPQVDPVRVIEIESVDSCPCGGTHVRSTGEIGPVRFANPRPGEGPSARVELTLEETVPPTPPA